MLPCGYQKDLGFPRHIRETAIHSLNRVRAVAESGKWNSELVMENSLPLTGVFFLFVFLFCLKIYIYNQCKNVVLSFLALLLVSLHHSLLVEVFFFFNELMFNLISLVSFLSRAG